MVVGTFLHQQVRVNYIPIVADRKRHGRIDLRWRSLVSSCGVKFLHGQSSHNSNFFKFLYSLSCGSYNLHFSSASVAAALLYFLL